MDKKDWLRFWLLGVVWGTSFLWIKIAVTEVSPFVLVSFRTLFGMLGLAAILAVSPSARPDRAAILKTLPAFVLIGLFNVAVPFTLISWAEKFIDSGVASILNSTTPLFSIVLAPLFLKDDPFTWRKAAGLLVGFLGVFVLLSPDLGQAMSSNLLGQGAMLLATLSYAGATIYARKASQGLPAPYQSFMQLLLATVFMWTLTLASERPLHLPALPITWVALLWLGLLGSCLAYLLYFTLLHNIGPTRTTTVTYTLPLFGVILGAVFLGERLYVQSIIGGALIISGILVVNLGQFSTLAARFGRKAS